MKLKLVDAINCFFLKDTGILKEMQEILDSYPNKKIILTGANQADREKYNFFNMPYEVFTLEHNPDKGDGGYYEKMLEHFKLKSEDVIYFEHNMRAIEKARELGILTHFYDNDKKDLVALKKFLDDNL